MTNERNSRFVQRPKFDLTKIPQVSHANIIVVQAGAGSVYINFGYLDGMVALGDSTQGDVANPTAEAVARVVVSSEQVVGLIQELMVSIVKTAPEIVPDVLGSLTENFTDISRFRREE